MEKQVNLRKLSKNLNFSELLVKRNFVEFEYANDEGKIVEKLRVRKLNTAEELELTDKRNELKIKLLRDPNHLTREALIELYKSKNINIEDLDKQWEDLQKEKEQYQCSLTELNNTPREKSEEIQRLEKKIDELERKQFAISSEKVDLLSCSIEDEIGRFWNMYCAYLETEVLKEKKWVKKWNSYEEMLKDDPELVGLCLLKTMEFNSGFNLPIEI